MLEYDYLKLSKYPGNSIYYHMPHFSRQWCTKSNTRRCCNRKTLRNSVYWRFSYCYWDQLLDWTHSRKKLGNKYSINCPIHMNLHDKEVFYWVYMTLHMHSHAVFDPPLWWSFLKFQFTLLIIRLLVNICLSVCHMQDHIENQCYR